MDRLSKKRIEIDKIDSEIMKLLNHRFDISIEVGEIKKEEELYVLDSTRENRILDKTNKYSHSPQIKNVYKEIMLQSKTLQGK